MDFFTRIAEHAPAEQQKNDNELLFLPYSVTTLRRY